MMHPLSIYIHWPFCKSKCPYCDFNSHVRDSVDQERWKAALLKDLEHYCEILHDRQVVSIFFGGGTPSLMPPDTVAALIDTVQRHWQIANNIEITLEANPTSVEASRFAAFASAGINRVSLGVQALNDNGLAFLGRHHSVTEALAAVELAQRLFSRSSFDLIYARPNQTVREWEEELTRALALSQGHLSLYQLTIEENTAFAHQYARGDFTLPQDDRAVQLYQLTHNMTSTAGLPAYETSNYAQPGEESRHNLAYWEGTEYIGIGPGAHGRYIQGSAQQASAIAHWCATDTIKSPERWLESIERADGSHITLTPLKKRERMEEMLMMGLRLNRGIDKAFWQQQSGTELTEILSPTGLAKMLKHDFLIDSVATLRTTMQGQLLLNSVLKELV